MLISGLGGQYFASEIQALSLSFSLSLSLSLSFQTEEISAHLKIIHKS